MGVPTGKRRRVATRSETRPKPPLSLLELPPDLLGVLFAHVPAVGLCSAAAACRALHAEHVPAAARERAVLLGHALPALRPFETALRALRFVELMSERAPSTMSADTCHTLAIADGSVLSWGGHQQGPMNEDEEGDDDDDDENERRCWLAHLGHGRDVGRSVAVATPVVGLGGVVIREVAAGYEHSLFLSAEGRVWSCGVGEHGRLGHGGTDGCAQPRRIEHAVLDAADAAWPFSDPARAVPFERVVQVVAGGFQSLALTSDGRAWSWGWGDSGSLGHGAREHRFRPSRIAALDGAGLRVVQASAGSGHSLFVTDRGDLYACGDHRYGKLGLGGGDKVSEDITVPRYVKFRSPTVRVRQASAWHAHSLVVTTTGKLYAFGCGAKGRLGLGATSTQYTPRLVASMKNRPVLSAAAGEQHSCVQTVAGECYAFGDSIYGQVWTRSSTRPVHARAPLTRARARRSLDAQTAHPFGGADDLLAQTPRPIGFFGERVAEIAVGDHHTVVRDVGGVIYAFGKNQESQLGLGPDDTRLCVGRPERVLIGGAAHPPPPPGSPGASTAVYSNFASPSHFPELLSLPPIPNSLPPEPNAALPSPSSPPAEGLLPPIPPWSLPPAGGGAGPSMS